MEEFFLQIVRHAGMSVQRGDVRSGRLCVGRCYSLAEKAGGTAIVSMGLVGGGGWAFVHIDHEADSFTMISDRCY